MADRLKRYRDKRDAAATSEAADARRDPQSTEPESVKTGRTINVVAEEDAENRA